MDVQEMELTDYILLSIEIIGTAAFAISGACAATQRSMDFFGVVCLALVTAVGGGIIRDVVLGLTPPLAFQNPLYAGVALLTAGLILILARFYGSFIEKKIFSGLLSPLFKVCDAIGLGIFTIVGVNTAVEAGYGENLFLLVFVGTITGVGGGIIRDILAGITPIILRREIYAVASIAGVFVYFLLLRKIDPILAMMAALAFIVALRLFAIFFNLHLPVPASIYRKRNENNPVK